jgi:hypothetical protein
MTSPIVQNDGRLNPQIRKAGCLFRSLSMLAEIKAGKTLTATQIEEQYEWLVDEALMLETCFVYDHEAVIKSAQYYIAVPQSARYVFRSSESGTGDFDNGGPHNAHIGHAKTIHGNGHFFATDRGRSLIWDPWWPRPERDYELTFRGYYIGG